MVTRDLAKVETAGSSPVHRSSFRIVRVAVLFYVRIRSLFFHCDLLQYRELWKGTDMSQADEIFKKMCRDIIDNGTDTRGQEVRPHWPDGTAAYTIKQFGVVNRYDLREEFPAVTLRRTAIKSATDEILWIWQKKSNDIKELHSHIWDEWAGEDGTIGKAYGYQLARKYCWNDITQEGLKRVYGDDMIVQEVHDGEERLYHDHVL